ncbi:hypothetical protein A7L55_18480, partial [Acinetobacter baumannii]
GAVCPWFVLVLFVFGSGPGSGTVLVVSCSLLFCQVFFLQSEKMASADVEFRCFVGGLAWSTDDRSLQEAFSPYGEVVESKIISDRETGRSRGFGFVTFNDEQSMRDAIDAMNGKMLDGRSITVNPAQSRGNGGGGG